MQTPDPRPGAYYVTAIDGPRVAYLLGPYSTHSEALSRVQEARLIADRLDPRAWFYAYGTCRKEVADVQGVLNGEV